MNKEAMLSLQKIEPNEEGIHNDKHDNRRGKLVFADESQKVHTSTPFF